MIGFLAVLFPFVHRHGARAARRLLRRLRRHGRDWLVDVVVAFPFFVLDHRARLRARARAARSIYHRDHARRLGLLHAHRARRGPRARSAGVRARGAARPASRTPRILGRHLLPNVITQAIVFAMSDIVLVDPRDRHARLPRARRPAADAGLGLDDRRRPDVPDHPLGARDVPGHRDRASPALGLSLLADGLADLLAPGMTRRPILEVRDLRVEIPLAARRRPARSTARRSTSRRGEALGLVGESGSRQDA